MDDCQYLYVDRTREIDELTLEVIISEAKAQAPILEPRDDTEFEKLTVGARPIETDQTCRVFRLIFDRDHMVSYSVLNECYGKYPKSPEKFTGKLFRIFSRSNLLDFIRQTTSAESMQSDELKHYQLACLNHVVDVICTKPPGVSVSIPLQEQRQL